MLVKDEGKVVLILFLFGKPSSLILQSTEEKYEMFTTDLLIDSVDAATRRGSQNFP